LDAQTWDAFVSLNGRYRISSNNITGAIIYFFAPKGVDYSREGVYGSREAEKA